jgi:hypothetical protein
LNLDIGICLGFRAWDLGFPLRGVSASCFASGFCSCLIHQAQLPNKLGNYIFKLRLVTTEKGNVIARLLSVIASPLFVIASPLFVIASEAWQSMPLKTLKKRLQNLALFGLVCYHRWLSF